MSRTPISLLPSLRPSRLISPAVSRLWLASVFPQSSLQYSPAKPAWHDYPPFQPRHRYLYNSANYYDRVYGDCGEAEVIEWYDSTSSDGASVVDAIVDSVLLPLIREQQTRQHAEPGQEGQRLLRVLDLGCGLSRIPIELWKKLLLQGRDGAVEIQILGLDCSKVAVDKQKLAVVRERRKIELEAGGGNFACGDLGSTIEFVEADVLSNSKCGTEEVTAALPFDDSSFDLVWEKAFLDALFSSGHKRSRGRCEESEPIPKEISMLLRECNRILKPGTGRFVCLSRLSQEVNWNHLKASIKTEIGNNALSNSDGERTLSGGIRTFIADRRLS